MQINSYAQKQIRKLSFKSIKFHFIKPGKHFTYCKISLNVEMRLNALKKKKNTAATSLLNDSSFSLVSKFPKTPTLNRMLSK